MEPNKRGGWKTSVLSYVRVFPEEYLVYLKLAHIRSYYGDEFLDRFYECVSGNEKHGLPETHRLRLWCYEFRKRKVKLPPKGVVDRLYSHVDTDHVICALCGRRIPPAHYSRHLINYHFDWVVSHAKY